DTNLTASGGTIDDVENAVNSDLENLRMWLNANKLSLNIAKAEFMLIGSRSLVHTVSDSNLNIMIENRPIKQVKECKTLGVIVDPHLSWKSNTESICKKITSAISVIRKLKEFVDRDTLVSIFNAIYVIIELQCDHEENDTCLLLHSNCAAETHDTIIVKTPDTDVFLLCIAMCRTIGKKFLVMVGTGNRFRIIDTDQPYLTYLDKSYALACWDFIPFQGVTPQVPFAEKEKRSHHSAGKWRIREFQRAKFLEVWSRNTKKLQCQRLDNNMNENQAQNTAYMDQKSVTALILLDLSKAFDSVHHPTLLNKLRHIGASPEVPLHSGSKATCTNNGHITICQYWNVCFVIS
ncbi:Hypothetical predicted protein, partial [Paramuricea clavata]